MNKSWTTKLMTIFKKIMRERIPNNTELTENLMKLYKRCFTLKDKFLTFLLKEQSSNHQITQLLSYSISSLALGSLKKVNGDMGLFF
jgi:hypothetical protein